MKALKILGGIVLTILLAIAIFYVGWFRAPSAEAVCDNVAAVTKKETGVDLGAKERADCIRRIQPPDFGRIPWVKRVKCMRDAGSLAELEACRK
jgi:hypothetical protein